MRIYCEHCGHSITLYRKVDFIICNHCGYKVYLDKKTKFRTIITEQLKKIKRMEKRNEQSNIIRQLM